MKKQPKEEDRPLLSGEEEADGDHSTTPPPPYRIPVDLPRSDDGCSPARKRLRRFLAAALLFVVVVGLMTRWCAGTNHKHRGSHPGNPHDNPSNMGTTHKTCYARTQPLHSSLHAVTFSPTHSLTVAQHPRHVHGAVTVRGSVSVHPSESGQGSITVDASATRRDLEIEVLWDEKAQTLEIVTPSAGFGALMRRDCVEVRVAIYAPSGAQLDSLSIKAVSLGVLLAEGVELDVEMLSVGLVSGNVDVHETALAGAGAVHITTISGDVNADLPLARDTMLKTTSGPISLTLHPHKARSGLTTSALDVQSTSGDIRAKWATTDDSLPSAEYTTRISSTSGRLDVALGFTSGTELSTLSGAIKADMTPLLLPQYAGPSSLRTTSTSGYVDLTVRQPVWLDRVGGGKGDDDAVFALESRHKTVSGNQRIVLPDAWEGSFTAKSLSGRVSVAGSGVEVQAENKDGDGAGGRGRLGKTVRGRRGKGKSEAEVEATSGNISLYIG